MEERLKVIIKGIKDGMLDSDASRLCCKAEELKEYNELIHCMLVCKDKFDVGFLSNNNYRAFAEELIKTKFNKLAYFDELVPYIEYEDYDEIEGLNGNEIHDFLSMLGNHKILQTRPNYKSKQWRLKDNPYRNSVIINAEIHRMIPFYGYPCIKFNNKQAFLNQIYKGDYWPSKDIRMIYKRPIRKTLKEMATIDYLGTNSYWILSNISEEDVQEIIDNRLLHEYGIVELVKDEHIIKKFKLDKRLPKSARFT